MKRVICLVLTLLMVVSMFTFGAFALENPVLDEELDLTAIFFCGLCKTGQQVKQIPSEYTYFGEQYESEGVTMVNLYLDVDKAIRWEDHVICENTEDPYVTYARYDGQWKLLPKSECSYKSFGYVPVIHDVDFGIPVIPNRPGCTVHPSCKDHPACSKHPTCTTHPTCSACHKHDCALDFSVTIDYNRGCENDIKVVKVHFGKGVKLETPVRKGYTFAGWYIGTMKYWGEGLYLPTTITAKWIRNTTCKDVCHDDCHKNCVESCFVVCKHVCKDVCHVACHKDCGKVCHFVSCKECTKVTKPALNTKDHVAYLKGYGAGEIRPEGNVTRAEVATILYRLLDDASQKYYYTTENKFTDVNEGDWFNEAVSTLSNAGVIKGYGAGKFNPNESITRAELITMLARLSGLDYTAKCRFVDVADNHWAYKSIALAQAEGWVKGYGAGYFYPSENITRAEVATILNRMLDRDCVLKDTRNYVDNPVNAWYYQDMLRASIAH